MMTAGVLAQQILQIVHSGTPTEKRAGLYTPPPANEHGKSHGLCPVLSLGSCTFTFIIQLINLLKLLSCENRRVAL